jgi:hypothetical protein
MLDQVRHDGTRLFNHRINIMTKGDHINSVKSICISLLILLIVMVVNANAVGVVVGPDGKVKSTKLNLPFVFYNQSFGAAAGYGCRFCRFG